MGFMQATGYIDPQLSGIAKAETGQPDAAVMQALKEQAEALHALETAVAPLEGRLSAVLAQPSPVAELASEPPGWGVPLANEISANSERIVALARHLEQLTQRLGI